MNLNIKSQIRAEAEGFIKHLKLKSQPQIFFVEKAGVEEAKVNEFFPDDKTSIYFNTAFLQKLNVQFAIIIMLHEIYHFAKQGIKTVKDVSEMRYGHLWSFMQLYDIEADLKVVEYLVAQNVVGTFAQYLSILHEGAGTFKNPSIRLPKLERFIGSLITIKLFFGQNGGTMHLPKLYLNWLMLISVNSNEGTMHFSNFDYGTEDLEKWKRVYQDASLFSRAEYVVEATALAEALLNKIDNEQ